MAFLQLKTSNNFYMLKYAHNDFLNGEQIFVTSGLKFFILFNFLRFIILICLLFFKFTIKVLFFRIRFS